MKRLISRKTIVPLATLAGLLSFNRHLVRVSAQSPLRFSGPTSSQPLALSADDSLLIVANPDNNTVTLFDAKNGNARIGETPVGKEPNGVALSPDGNLAYVANTVDGTVSVLAINRNSPNYATVVRTVAVGTEPYGLALTPTGRKLYVSNARSNTVSVIDTQSNYSVKTIANVGPEPRGISITNSGSGDDSQETVYVTQFLSLPVDGKVDGADDAKAGHVTIISAATDSIFRQRASVFSPASVRLSLRVERCSSLMPSLSSRATTCLVTMVCDRSSTRAAAEKLPRAATRTKTCMLVTRSSMDLSHSKSVSSYSIPKIIILSV